MKDIGLGIFDRYTVVIIIIIVLVLAQVLFGGQIPLDTAGGVQLFVSLVVFTGYIYLAYSIVRLPIALFHAQDIAFKTFGKHYELSFSPKYIFIYGSVFRWILGVLFSIIYLPLRLFYLLIKSINFAESIGFDDSFWNTSPEKSNRKKILAMIWDRLGLVSIAGLSAVPFFHPYVYALGIVGAILMVILFLFRGNFMALLNDELVKATNAKKEKPKDIDVLEAAFVTAKEQDKKLIPETSNCAICGKVCAPNKDHPSPQACSLECCQKWFANWDKDWCIGYGRERQLLNLLRQDGYGNPEQVERVVSQLEQLPGSRSIWALLATIRDSEAVIIDYESKNICDLAEKSLNQKISALDKDSYRDKYALANILYSCISDKNFRLVKTCMNLIDRLLDDGVTPSKIDPERVLTFLQDEKWNHDAYITNPAIRLVALTNHNERLVEFIEENLIDDHELYAVIKIFSESVPPSIQTLRRLQHHKTQRIRNEAIGALKKLGIDASEPDLVIHKISCIRCSLKMPVDVPSSVEKIECTQARLTQMFSLKPRVLFVCPICDSVMHLDLGIVLDHPTVEKITEAMEARQEWFRLDGTFYSPLNESAYLV